MRFPNFIHKFERFFHQHPEWSSPIWPSCILDKAFTCGRSSNILILTKVVNKLLHITKSVINQPVKLMIYSEINLDNHTVYLAPSSVHKRPLFHKQTVVLHHCCHSHQYRHLIVITNFHTCMYHAYLPECFCIGFFCA